MTSLAESVVTENLDDMIDDGNGFDSAGDEVFRRQMRATAKVKGGENSERRKDFVCVNKAKQG